MKKLTGLAVLCCLTQVALADIDVTSSVLANGIDTKNFNVCAQALKQCIADTRAKDDTNDFQTQMTCSQNLYHTNPSCVQTEQIESLAGIVPLAKNIHREGTVTWFFVTYPADGIDAYYLLDSAGRLLGLASSQNPLLGQSPNYLQFMKPYPDGALQSRVVSERKETPTLIRRQADGARQFVFSQYVQKVDCIACAKAGTADVVYYFDKAGHYQGVQLAALHPNPISQFS